MSNANNIHTVEKLRELLAYDADSGILIWRVNIGRKIKAGSHVGHLNSRGYVQTNVNGVTYKAHRLALAIFYGLWPDGQVDHINGIKSDNRIKNLRVVSECINHQNLRRANVRNKVGLLGVSAHGKGWRAQIELNGKTHHIGTFSSSQVAHLAYVEAKRKLHAGCTI